MPDVDALIARIVAESRAKGGRAFASSEVYDSEPILFRGSQMASYLPEPCQRMRALARSREARSWSDARLFVEQARLMADHEDDFDYHGTFASYFPTYDAMSNPQLRGYFAWRTRVRRGRVEQTSASYAYVYLYELINGIGVEPGEEGFRAIESFWQRYREFEPSMDRYVRAWLVDYVVYHGLDAGLALPHAGADHDRAVGVLARAERRALAEAPARGRGAKARPREADASRDRELFDALDALSTYRPSDSRLFKDEPDDLVRVSCAVFDRLARYYCGSRTQGLVESLFGTRHELPHLMFASAVFWPAERHPDGTYDLGGIRRYECRSGIWTCEGLHDGGGRSAKLGQVMRAVDRQLRAALDYPHPLKERGDPKYLVALIDREVRDHLAWKRAHAPRHIEIDLTKLARIRSTATMTCESLLVDEEREGGEAEAAPPVASPVERAPVAPEPATPAATPPPVPLAEEDPHDLTADERSLLSDLLDGRTPARTGTTDLMVDAINEKLFDLLGDTALEFGADGVPSVVDDYRGELRAALAG